MASILTKLLYYLAANLIAKALIGAGLAVVTYAALVPVTMHALDTAAAAFGGMPGDMLSVLSLGGIGQALTIVGSALLTRVSLVAGLAGLARAAAPSNGAS